MTMWLKCYWFCCATISNGFHCPNLLFCSSDPSVNLNNLVVSSHLNGKWVELIFHYSSHINHSKAFNTRATFTLTDRPTHFVNQHVGEEPTVHIRTPCIGFVFNYVTQKRKNEHNLTLNTHRIKCTSKQTLRFGETSVSRFQRNVFIIAINTVLL